MTAPIRIQRQRTKGWRMPPGAVYVGRPTLLTTQQVASRLAEDVGTILEHAEPGVAVAAERAAVVARSVVVVPAEAIGSATDGALWIEPATRAVGALVVARSGVGFSGATEPFAAVPGDDLGRTALGADCRAHLSIQARQAMSEPLRGGPGRDGPGPEPPVVARDTEPASPARLVALRVSADRHGWCKWGVYHG